MKEHDASQHTEILARSALTSRMTAEISPERPRKAFLKSAVEVGAPIVRNWSTSARAWRLQNVAHDQLEGTGDERSALTQALGRE